MKATVWIFPLFTLLCATRIVCQVSRGGFDVDDYDDANMIQNDYWLHKRNKPSLSIVNPLDVLRQRLLLEIARRQMKENTRQVELNRAILKNVGKRGPIRSPYNMLLPYQLQLLEQQQDRYLPIILQNEDHYMSYPITSKNAMHLYNDDNKKAQHNENEVAGKQSLMTTTDTHKTVKTNDDDSTSNIHYPYFYTLH